MKTLESLSLDKKGQRARMETADLVKHPGLEEGFRILSQFHQALAAKDELRCMYILGESGTGKTTLIDYYLSSLPDKRMPNIDIRSAVYVRAPSSTSLKNLGAQILVALGIPTSMRMTHYEISACVHKLLRTMNVEIIIIDEVQDLFEQKPRSRRLPQLIANFIKEILQETDTGIVLAGTPYIEMISSMERQLKNRTADSVVLDGLYAGNAEDREAYRKFFSGLVEHNKLPLDLDICDPLVPFQFQLATDGNFAVTKRLLRFATGKAVREECACVRMKHIEYAQAKVNEEGEVNINPFNMSKDELVSWVKAEDERRYGIYRDERRFRF